MSDSNDKKGVFVAVGHSMLRVTSVDGENWSKPQLGKPGEILRAVCHANGRFVALGYSGGSNYFGTSADGVNWKTQGVGNQYSWYIRDVVFGNGKFHGFGGEPPFLQTTEDGSTWTDRTVFKDGFPLHPNDRVYFSRVFSRVKYGNDRFMALGQLGWRGISKNGLEWKTAEDIKTADAFIDVACGNGIFVGAGLHGLRMTNTDGLKWTDRVVGEEGEHINTILWAGDRFVGIGAGATYISADGRRWERRPNRNAPLRAAYGDGVFVGCHWKGRLLHSKDAVNWMQVMKCDDHIEAVTYGNR